MRQAKLTPTPPRGSVLLPCIFALFVVTHLANAQDISAEIEKHQERYAKLRIEFNASQDRILASPTTFETQQRTYDLLVTVGDHLLSVDREFDVLIAELALSSLVTDKRAVPHAKRFIEHQRTYMSKTISTRVQYIDRIMHQAKDPETARLLLQARDLLRSSADFLERMQATEAKRK
jgi:hypothetical protein